MTDRPLPADLAAHLDADVAELVADVRAEAIRRVRARLVETYAGALDSRLLASAPTTEPTPSGTGTYLYAVVAGDGTGVPAGSDGVQRGRPVRLVTEGDLTAVVSEVDLSQLAALTSGDAVTEDGPLAQAVRAHDAVVDTAFRAGPVVPLRFGTVVADEAGVRRLVRAHGEALRQELDHLATGQEWGVKVFADAPAEPAAHDEPVDSGRDYLVARSRRRTAAAQAAQRRAVAADTVHASLLELAVDGVATGGRNDATCLLTASYLVRRSDEPRFLQTLGELAQELARDGFRIERTGPWPPYHFVRLDLSGEVS